MTLSHPYGMPYRATKQALAEPMRAGIGLFSSEQPVAGQMLQLYDSWYGRRRGSSSGS